MSGVEKGEWKVVSREGGATEGLINHSCIVIDFLLKGVSQTLNYVFVRVRIRGRVCVAHTSTCESTKSSITVLDFPKVWHCSWFSRAPTTFFIPSL